MVAFLGGAVGCIIMASPAAGSGAGLDLDVWHYSYVMGDLSPFDHSLGLTLLAEWKGRNDGLVAHAFFKGSPNFALSVLLSTASRLISFSILGLRTPPGKSPSGNSHST